MLPVNEAIDQLLHEVVETLAPLDRTPCSPGEREAAEWLAARLASIEGVDAELEEETSWGTFPPTAALVGASGLTAAIAALRGRRGAATLLALACAAGLVDEAQNGPRVLRRAIRRRKRTVNVVARAGDGEAIDTLVVIAHHDAPQTGLLFDQSLQRRAWERSPERLGHAKTPLPQWWLGLAAPLGALLTALSGRRAPARVGLAVGGLATALLADVWRSATVPGANDNLSGVAALVALGELLAAQRPSGLRVLLVSCGAEETLQDGIRAFVARHREALPPERTVFLNVDTIGSPHLIMLEGEGPVWMERYSGPWLRDLVADSAAAQSVPLERGFLARSSTDSVIPSRAGYPTATLVSITDWRMPANYHLPSDVPENLDYATVADAVRVMHEVVERLVARSATGGGRIAADNGGSPDAALSS
jgi:Peptidase family M28